MLARTAAGPGHRLLAMQCHVLLFAQLRDVIGRERIDIDLPEGATVNDAIEALAALHKAIAQMRGRLAVAVDEKYQPFTTKLCDGCTMALIPPVSGG